MDSTWVFNFDYNYPPTNTPQYFDIAIIPSIFYNAVINRNIGSINNIIKYNPKLSIKIVTFYIMIQNAFYIKNNAKFGSPVRIQWKVNQNKPLILNFNDQVYLYQYVTRPKWIDTNFGFLVNSINNYIINLRTAMNYINNNYPANKFYKYGINIKNNSDMKKYITNFII